MRAGIIADDLTGACDAAARAALAGWRVRVLLDGLRELADLCVVSTASRNCEEADAAAKAADAARGLMARGIRPLFKKIDSTLRGAWAAETAAVAAAVGAEVVAICPAFPDCGRTVRGGVVYDSGQAVGELAPPLDAAGLHPGARRPPGSPEVVVGDAATDAELAFFVDSVAARGRTVLWVGSAGLARYALGQRDNSRLPQPAADKWLVVAGSTHPATLKQLEGARSAGHAVITKLGSGFEFTRGTGLFLIGGDTAEKVLRALGAGALDITGEALPGIAIGRVIGGSASGSPVMTKAGGFGGADAVTDAIRIAAGHHTVSSG